MNIARAWEFAEVEAFYERYEPLTPYGREEREKREIHCDKNRLDEIFSLTKNAATILSRGRAISERLSHHLRRIPALPPTANRTFDLTEIFLVKKFLLNCSAIARVLGHEDSVPFRLNFTSQSLLDLLGKGGQNSDDETFYLAESYSPSLAEVRAEIRLLDEKTTAARRQLTEVVLSESGIDLRFREFAIIETSLAKSLPENLISLEPYDSRHFVARPLLPLTLVEALSLRDDLLKREAVEEAKVLEFLSEEIARHNDQLAGYIIAIRGLDTSLARAALITEFSLVEPNLESAFPNDTDENIVVAHGARLLPLEWRCAENKLRYWPLNLVLNRQANAIFGSNMGGKTVVLKTLVFLQILAQMGFFVPASRFQSRLFKQIGYVGALGSTAGNSDHIEGLSGFGSEIHAFITTWEKHKSPMLLAVDEFARTTNSCEASALVSALLRRVAEQPQVLALVSTHFMDLQVPSHQASFFRMKGLNRSEYHKTFSKTTGGQISTRIRAINQFMQFELVEERDGAPIQDAIAIAELLGLDSEIIESARQILGENHVRKTGTESKSD